VGLGVREYLSSSAVACCDANAGGVTVSVVGFCRCGGHCFSKGIFADDSCSRTQNVSLDEHCTGAVKHRRSCTHLACAVNDLSDWQGLKVIRHSATATATAIHLLRSTSLQKRLVIRILQATTMGEHASHMKLGHGTNKNKST